MLLLLRRLKLDLFMTRSFRKYSAYAFGEILLLVIGILIALQINDWYQQRLDRQTESEYLVSMHRDLTKDIRELRAAIKGNESLLAGLNDTLLLLAEPRDDDAWRRDLYIHGLKYTYWFIVAEFSRLTMAQLQYSGGMRLITNTQLRESMIAYEQGLETAQLQSRDVMTYFHELEESHKRLFDLKLSKRAMEFIEEDYLNMLQPIDVFQSLVPEGIYLSSEDSSLINHYYDDMLYYRTALNILTLMYRQQLKQAESLSKLIENPLSVSDQHEA
jgi:hypothetical protein